MIVSAPVADNQNSLTAGPRGPVRLLIWYLFIVPARKWDHPNKVVMVFIHGPGQSTQPRSERNHGRK